MRILLVEDEAKLAADLAEAIEAGGHVVETEGDGEDAWFRGDTEDYDLAILDLGLPGLDGTEIIKRWRASRRLFPVLVLTARDSWAEKAKVIDLGADDYLTKPFHMEELQARVRALLRRQTPHASATITVGEFTLDTRFSRLARAGQPIELTPLEYRLLHYLMHHVGRPVSQHELIEHVYAEHQDRDANAVEVLVTRLRRKLGNELVRTRRGFGYYVGELDESTS
jgi:two-component system OmpR family response regulator